LARAITAFTTLSLLVVLYLRATPSSFQEGVVTVSPDSGVAGNFGTWTVTYRAGAQGIAEGGGVRVELPDTWHAGDRNSANPLQATNPRRDHYVSARSSRDSVRLETIVEGESDDVLVKSARQSLDGRSERYVWVVRVKITQGTLHSGDTLSVVYGDTSAGSRGMRAAVVATPPEPILVAVDTAGTGRFELHAGPPTIRAKSGPPAQLHLYGPSDVVVGRPSELRLAVVDANANPVADFEGDVRFQIVQGSVQLAEVVRQNLARGWGAVPFTPTSAGILRISASALGGILNARSNPIRVNLKDPERSVYWGDLHSHSQYSWDGVGASSFDYARHVSALDFYALTDHSSMPAADTRGLGPHVWQEYNALTDKHYDPGRFVTFHAYEASFGTPYGHHNVYFRGEPGPLLAPGDSVGLPELWKALTAGNALTVPHHTGKFPGGVRWDVHNPELRRNFEIYSAHGLSEAFDRDHPLAFEQSDFTAPSQSANGPQFAQDAWAHGLVLSTIASSDDHRAQPGRPHWGLAAVRAAGLSREEVFDALYERRTYGTTGARILLEFSVNGQPMGQTATASTSPRLEIAAHGTDIIEEVQVLRYSKSARGFDVIHTMQPEALDFTWASLDPGFREDSIYYVRLRQRGQIGGRIAMAWSSPLWVKFNQLEHQRTGVAK
jgi:hypothetical protein